MSERMETPIDDLLEDDSAVDFIVDEEGEPCISVLGALNAFYEADT